MPYWSLRTQSATTESIISSSPSFCTNSVREGEITNIMALNNLKIVSVTVLIMLMLMASNMADAAGECGRTPIGSVAAGLALCLGATRNVRARVPPACCARVGAMIRMSPRCLCAVLLSPMARQAKINPAIAVTVPKRCNIRNRPAGKKCGRYTVP